MKIAYYPGCTLKTTAKNFEVSAVKVSGSLGIEFVEIPRWNCCGTFVSLADDDIMHHIAPIRNLIRVEDLAEKGLVDGSNIVTLCSICFNTLKTSSKRIEDRPDDLVKINEFMSEEKEYKKTVKTLHLLEILKELGYDKVRSKVKRSLKGLKVFPYYGCTLLRPKEIGIDDPETPDIFEGLLTALGAKPVQSNKKKMCCGSYHTVYNKDMVVELAHSILSDAQENGAEIAVTSCPLCAFNLDNRQRQIIKKYPDFKPIPILYFTQLMGIAFGLDDEFTRISENHTKSEKLFKEKKIIKEK